MFALIDSFRMGYKALSISADKLTEGDEEEELTGIDKWLTEHLGDKITGVIMTIASILGIALAILCFSFCPPCSLTCCNPLCPETSPDGALFSRVSCGWACS